MKQLLSSIYAYIDFPDEDLTDVPGMSFIKIEISAISGQVA